MEVTDITIRVKLALVTPSRVAVMLVVPAVTPVVKPAELIVAVVEVSLAHVTRELRSAVEPSEYVPVAVNCCVEPTIRLAGVEGVTAMEDNVITVKLIAWLVIPSTVAVMSAVPVPVALAMPMPETAILVLLLFHVT
jgi:hypothetical protein